MLCCAASVLLLHRLLEPFAARLYSKQASPAKALSLVWMLPCLPGCPSAWSNARRFSVRDGVSLKHQSTLGTPPPPAAHHSPPQPTTAHHLRSPATNRAPGSSCLDLSIIVTSRILPHCNTSTPFASHSLSGLSTDIHAGPQSHDPLLPWHPAWNQTVRMAIIALFAARSPSHVIPVGAGSMLRPRPPQSQGSVSSVSDIHFVGPAAMASGQRAPTAPMPN